MTACRKPHHITLDQKSGQTTRSRVRIGFGINDQDISIWPIGDPELIAIEPIVSIALLGSQAHRYHIRARACLTHRQRPDVIARDQFGQVFAFLLCGSVETYLIDAEI